MNLSQVEGVWWAPGTIELIPGPESTEVSLDEGGVVDGDGGGTIYDLPTNRSDFLVEADRKWSDFENECDPQGRRGTDLTALYDYIYGKSCSDSTGATSGANNEDGSEDHTNNQNGSTPGGD